MKNKTMLYNIFVYEYIPGHGDSYRNYENSALDKKFAIKLAKEKFDEILRDCEEQIYAECKDERDCWEVDKKVEKYIQEAEKYLNWDANELFKELGIEDDCYGEHAVSIEEKELAG